MKLLVHIGTRGSGVKATPLLNMVELRGDRYNEQSTARMAADLKSFSRPLVQETKMQSGYEEVFKSVILELGLRVDYEPFSLRLGNFAGREMIFTPDFVTDLTMDGRQVIIDPHGMHNHERDEIIRELARFRLFGSIYKKRFYFIMASDLGTQALKLRTGATLGSVIDEYWETPVDRTLTKASVRERFDLLLRRAERNKV